MKAIKNAISAVFSGLCDFFLCPPIMVIFILIGLGVGVSYFVVIPKEQEREAKREAFIATAPKTMCVGGYEYKANYSKYGDTFFPTQGARMTEILNGYVVYKKCDPYKMER